MITFFELVITVVEDVSVVVWTRQLPEYDAINFAINTVDSQVFS